MSEIPYEEREQWLRHEVTGAIRENLQKEVASAYTRFMGYARKSSDPEVRDAVTRFEVLTKALKLFQEEDGPETAESSGA